MLDRAKVIKELYRVADNLFVDNADNMRVALDAWKTLVNDAAFVHKVRAFSDANFHVPDWCEVLEKTYVLEESVEPYIGISVDGSQIYPDRHQGISCFLINVGTVVIPYRVEGCAVNFNSLPFVFGNDAFDIAQNSMTDLVNAKRQEFEFIYTQLYAQRLQKKYSGVSLLVLCDGSLIFWHLLSKETQFRDYFLKQYLASLELMYQQRIPMLGYISLTKSKELINLIRLQLCNFDVSNEESYSLVNGLLDSSIVRSFLPEGHRTILFKNQSVITKKYPSHLHPYFFYINVGHEIARVELPAWVAHDEDLVQKLANQLYDQCKKGGGYPTLIAEAHEQAVVKGADREFFYHVLNKISTERYKRSVISRKSLRKKRMGI